MMEKYGVDNINDKVEAEAQRMVKTGEQKDLQKAREEAIKKIERELDK